MDNNNLISLLKTMVDLNDKDVQLIDNLFEKMTVNKNEILVDYNTTAKHLYFIVSGYIRVFHYEKGIEITNHLASKNYFVTAYNSFTTKTPSEEIVQTISDCILMRITKENLDQLYKKSHNMALFGIQISDRYLVYNNQRSKDLITLNAEQKYLKFMKEEPHILQNVPLQYISSFIGIEPQTLSRIRRKIIT